MNEILSFFLLLLGFNNDILKSNDSIPTQKIKVEYNLKQHLDGLKFYQDGSGSLSILDLDLNLINVSFGGLINEIDIDNKVEEKSLFYRFYAGDFFENFKNNKNYDIFAIVNGQFFNAEKNLTGLSFPIKSDGKIITSHIDNDIKKRTLVIDYDFNANILEGYETKFLEEKRYKELIVAFSPNVDAQKDAKIGRTYIGLFDSKHIVFFIAKNKSQEQMNDIIENYGIKNENVIMMDGGPSSQFSFIENGGTKFSQYYGKWKVPHFFIIYNDK